MAALLNVLTVTLPPDKAFFFKLFIMDLAKEMTRKFMPQIEKWKLNGHSRHIWISCQGRCVIVKAEGADPAQCSM